MLGLIFSKLDSGQPLTHLEVAYGQRLGLTAIGGTMIYAEKRTDADGNLDEYGGNVEQGVFLSLAEFAAYRQQGWSSTPHNDMLADRLLNETTQDEEEK